MSLVSCVGPQQSLARLPILEVSQVPPYHWEIIIRLHDEAATGSSVRCRIYRVDYGEPPGQRTELKVAELRLAETKEKGEFIGIYSDGKEFPHGTEVVVVYESARVAQPVRASTRMYYH